MTDDQIKQADDVRERLQHVSQNTRDEYLHEVTGRAADTIAALVAEVRRLDRANYASFTDGMQAAAEICGSMAETEYDDADSFEAATGCEAAIMRVVKEQRAEQARAALENRHGE